MNIEKCSRQIENFSKIQQTDRFDKPTFNPNRLMEKLKTVSPKALMLLKQIEQLDQNDYNTGGKVYKHFIFSSISNGYGAKVLASIFIAAGYNLAMKKKGQKLIIDEEVLKNNSYNNFIVLSSTQLWGPTVYDKDTINNLLTVYNNRINNIYGKKIRFIILDSGFKEGIDLFDVKYGHIFEQQRTKADLTQAIGRGTRFCGQKGLPYIKNKGWILNIFNYKTYISFSKYYIFHTRTTLLDQIYKMYSNIDISKKIQESIINTIKDSSIDYYLNKNINDNNSKQLKKYTDKINKKHKVIAISLGFLSSLTLFNILHKK